MKSGRARLVVSLALALVFSFATASHDEVVGTAALGVGSLQHQHGPFGTCPEIKHHHCLACAAAHVVPAPTVSHVVPFVVHRTVSTGVDTSESRAPLPIRSGRSPPASSRVA